MDGRVAEANCRFLALDGPSVMDGREQQRNVDCRLKIGASGVSGIDIIQKAD